jgi:hypothetical protein
MFGFDVHACASLPNDLWSDARWRARDRSFEKRSRVERSGRVSKTAPLKRVVCTGWFGSFFIFWIGCSLLNFVTARF